MGKIIIIEWDEYERIFHEWVQCTYHRVVNVTQHNFDKAIGIKYSQNSSSTIDESYYYFEITNEEKFMLAAIKFAIKFQKDLTE